MESVFEDGPGVEGARQPRVRHRLRLQEDVHVLLGGGDQGVGSGGRDTQKDNHHESKRNKVNHFQLPVHKIETIIITLMSQLYKISASENSLAYHLYVLIQD